MNPRRMLEFANLQQKFKKNHPKVFPFLKAAAEKALARWLHYRDFRNNTRRQNDANESKSEAGRFGNRRTIKANEKSK